MDVVPRSIRLSAFAVFLLIGCSDPEPPAPGGLDTYPEQQTQDYHTQHTQAGVVVWELWGDSAERYSGENELRLHDVRMVFYREGVKDAVLTSDRGDIDEITERTTARGNVIVVSEAGRRLESEILHWDPERALIHTDAFVRFTDGDQIVTGYGMETDPDLTDLVIERQVEGELPDESDPNSGREG